MFDSEELGNGISVQTYFSFEELFGIRTDWDEFVASVSGDVYMTFDWCHVWWKHYGDGRALRVYVFRIDGRLVGVLPFFFETIWIAPAKIRLAKVVGSDSTVSMVNLAIELTNASEVLDYALGKLAETEKCDVIAIGPLGTNCGAYECLKGYSRACRRVQVLTDHFQGPYTIFSLPTSFEEYLATLDSGERKRIRKAFGLADRSFSWKRDVVTDGSYVQEEFEAFVRMHTAQWAGKGKLGHFGDWPGSVAFNAEMASTQGELGRLRLMRTIADGVVVSYQLSYAFAGRLHTRLPGRLVGPEWDKFGLGRLDWVKIVEMAIQENIGEIEGGGGNYTHKSNLGAKTHSLHSFIFTRINRLSRVKARILLHFSKILHYCYYRVWFLKLAPKFPLKRRPLWKLWIRTRL